MLARPLISVTNSITKSVAHTEYIVLWSRQPLLFYHETSPDPSPSLASFPQCHLGLGFGQHLTLAYPGLPWPTRAYTGLPWPTLAYILPWLTLAHTGLPLPLPTLAYPTLAHPGLPHTLAYPGLPLPWPTLTSLGLPHTMAYISALAYLGLPWLTPYPGMPWLGPHTLAYVGRRRP